MKKKKEEADCLHQGCPFGKVKFGLFLKDFDAFLDAEGILSVSCSSVGAHLSMKSELISTSASIKRPQIIQRAFNKRECKADEDNNGIIMHRPTVSQFH